MSEIVFKSAAEMAGMLQRREVSSRELLGEYLTRIDDHRESVNAVVTVDAERATKRAAEADEATVRGEVWGPLHGLPITAKDVYEVAGVRSASASEELADHVPEEDADAIALTRAAGAIVFGKSNMPEYGGHIQSFNDLFGRTNNPWDQRRTPGGSSGGSAAAVAAAHTAFDIGSDIGGSSRLPASWCGVYGHKPTYGLVPFRGHVPPAPGSFNELDLCVVGPLARSADDLDLSLDVLAAPEPERAIAWRVELPPPRADSLSGYRLAAWLDDAACPLDDTVMEVLEATIDELEAEGATIDRSARPVDLGESLELYMTLLACSAAGLESQEEHDAVADFVAGADPEDDSLPVRLARSSLVSARDRNLAVERRHVLRRQWAEFFSRFDALLCPITQVVAPPHDPVDPSEFTFTINGEVCPIYDMFLGWGGAIASLPYLPATVAPVGMSRQGLPIGIQVVGPYLEDRTTIDVARRLTQVTGGYQIPPGFGPS